MTFFFAKRKNLSASRLILTFNSFWRRTDLLHVDGSTTLVKFHFSLIYSYFKLLACTILRVYYSSCCCLLKRNLLLGHCCYYWSSLRYHCSLWRSSSGPRFYRLFLFESNQFYSAFSFRTNLLHGLPAKNKNSMMECLIFFFEQKNDFTALFYFLHSSCFSFTDAISTTAAPLLFGSEKWTSSASALLHHCLLLYFGVCFIFIHNWALCRSFRG